MTQMVTHPFTNHAKRSLTWVIHRELGAFNVLSPSAVVVKGNKMKNKFILKGARLCHVLSKGNKACTKHGIFLPHNHSLSQCSLLCPSIAQHLTPSNIPLCVIIRNHVVYLCCTIRFVKASFTRCQSCMQVDPRVKTNVYGDLHASSTWILVFRTLTVKEKEVFFLFFLKSLQNGCRPALFNYFNLTIVWMRLYSQVLLESM